MACTRACPRAYEPHRRPLQRGTSPRKSGSWCGGDAADRPDDVTPQEMETPGLSHRELPLRVDTASRSRTLDLTGRGGSGLTIGALPRAIARVTAPTCARGGPLPYPKSFDGDGHRPRRKLTPYGSTDSGCPSTRQRRNRRPVEGIAVIGIASRARSPQEIHASARITGFGGSSPSLRASPPARRPHRDPAHRRIDAGSRKSASPRKATVGLVGPLGSRLRRGGGREPRSRSGHLGGGGQDDATSTTLSLVGSASRRSREW